jgi:hypothetical protein
VTAKKAGDQKRIFKTSRSGETVCNFRGIVGCSASLDAYASPQSTFLGGITMKHQNIRSKADRVALKRKHERRQPPHRRQEGISVRKIIKAFVYDVFDDGYLIGQLRRD